MLEEICRLIGVENVNLIDIVRERPHHLIGSEMQHRPFDGARLDSAWQKI